MKFNINLTWSKIVAVVLLAVGFYLDITNGGNSSVMYVTPFVVFLITGKQVAESYKNKNNEPIGK